MGFFNKKKKPTIEELKKEKNATLFTQVNHVNGLPISEDVQCHIYSCPGHYEIIVNDNTFNLDKNKVIDVSLKTDVEITKQTVSSVGGAVAGAVLFGPLGAIIGGRAKTKKTKETNHYLIFTYQSNGEVKYICFDTNFSVPMAKIFVDEFKKTNVINVTIDL